MAEPGQVAYCDGCGQRASAQVHESCQRARRLEPPRYCSGCGRRMVVQVMPLGWTARCVEHGTIADRRPEATPDA